MSKARSLLKKLRTKKQEEEGLLQDKKAEEKKNEPTNPIIVALQKQSRNSKSVPADARRESFVDPLDYFKKEHIFVKESNMEEYGGRDLQKELEEEKKKEQEAEKTRKIGGMIGVRNFKVNFEEMMKARAKIKKEVKNPVVEKPKYEYVKRGRGNKEENLYIKLILAKKKFNLANIHNLYAEVLRRIDELKGFNDFPDELKEELNYIIEDLKLENKLIICPDVQVVSDDEDDTDTIGKKANLDQVMNTMIIRPDM